VRLFINPVRKSNGVNLTPYVPLSILQRRRDMYSLHEGEDIKKRGFALLNSPGRGKSELL